ncbi:nitroreductase family protein [Solidesulfovibrio sp.]|uniref:nitroreductase family protein n=1 Tax=Solidesulfovibrio sp. TaxID=2910990 RepID=UPI002B1FDA23|nr:nitroreductase family protein [Solidesulfovibrio sp.]MEA5088271.1 nitroreductase family protein [Solidesulfovibrio sp.]
MEHMQDKGIGTSVRIMSIRGIPFKCPLPSGKSDAAASEDASAASPAPAAPVKLQRRPSIKAAAAVGADVAFRVNAGFCHDNLLLGQANPASGRCAWTGVASKAQQELFKSRRAVRVFADKVICMRVLRGLVDAASFPLPGATAGLARFVVLESVNAMDKVSELATAWLRLEGLLADGLPPDARPREVLFGGAPHMAVAYGPAGDAAAVAACSLAVARMEWLAAGQGLATCFAGEIVRAAAACPELFAAMAIPSSATVYAALFLGYPGSRNAGQENVPGTRITWL